ncbi:leucine-rich repeat-containing protein 31-like [Amphiura filiformis]|uniref:leucine-rich repeat-containing protein 31-like n=1 Tax=Amphiura filiformis TaxID=82378 RepID=UPI003B225B1D
MEQLGRSISQLPALATLILEGRDCDTSGIIGQLARNPNSTKSMQEFACNLSSFSIHALTIFLSRQPSLVRPKLLDNRMTEEDIGHLLEGIQEAKLEVLEIFWNLVGKSSRYIRSFLPTLQSLYLSNTKMNPDDWREIFCDLSKAVHIEKIDLTWNNIGSAVMMLADTGTALSKLRILILRKGYFVLGRDDMDILGRWLGSLVNLENLDLSDNDIGEASDEFPEQLSKLTSLTRLNLSATGLRKSTFRKVGSALKAMPNLKQLHLAENGVGEAIVDIADGLKGLSELTWLNLEECEMESDGVVALTGAFDGLLNLTNFYLHGNSKITPSGVEVLFQTLHRLQKLECLEMRGLEIAYEPCSLMVKECFDELRWRPHLYGGCEKVILDKINSEDVKKIASTAERFASDS